MPKSETRTPTFVAHRGASNDFPENTILAYQAAIDAGAKFVELDVQITADQIPMVHHDPDLLRITGMGGEITKMALADVRTRRAGYAEKFGDKFPDNRLATLTEFSGWLSQYPDVTAFVEIKRQSVEAFGPGAVAGLVLDAIQPTIRQSVIISFNDDVLHASKQLAPKTPIGWVVREYCDESLEKAERLNPEFLFCKTTRIPADGRVWSGPWTWVLYNTDTIADAKHYYGLGFEMLETNRIIDLLACPEFATP